ncbi:MAG: zinc-dependent metalloprotease [Myxococcales bacterium]|nr:zinc-dependent metalloprotease [Myxococcales bacterium]
MLPTHLRRRALLLLAGLALAACAEEVGDIDRTQPNLFEKSMFTEHSWYVRQTVIDVPPTSALSFVGETGEMEMIRWEIQQDYIVGYRAYEKVPGSESNADHDAARVGEQPVAEGLGEGRDPEVFKGNPIVAYPIEAHVDVIRDYNPRTGEQTNVIVENQADRPWHERAFIRVDWSSNLVGHFMFLTSTNAITSTNSGYVEENEGGADAFYTHLDDEGVADYFDFTERLFVEPTENGCILFLNNRIGDCASAEVKVRTSFLRVDTEREQDYVALRYDDVRQGEFGYFRTERPSYDRRRGVTWTGVSYMVNRHDLWQDSRDGDGNVRDYAERKLQPVTYMLSPGYPEELRELTDDIAAEWDVTLKTTMAELRGQSIEALEADLEDQTGASCMFCLDDNEDGEARIGDLRYNFLYWVDAPQLSGPLGYGPSSANPETGRIVAGMAYVYGAGVDSQAQYAKDVVDLINGDYDAQDFLEADFVRDEVFERKPRVALEALNGLKDLPMAEAREALLSAGHRARIEALKAEGLPSARPGYDRQQLSRIQGSPLQSLLVNDEMILAQGGGVYQPGDVLPEEFLQSLAPWNWNTVEARRGSDEKRLKAARNNLWLAELDDPAIVGLAKDAKDKGLEGDELWQHLRERIYFGVALHEIGHTVGLRHNFGSSADALNYHEQYWELREPTLVENPETLQDVLEMACEVSSIRNAEACEAQLEGRMREYQYSSIMDYGAKFNSDIHGLGRYDMAAVAAGYGDLIEVFDNSVTDDMLAGNRDLLVELADIRTPVVGSLPEVIHYTELPRLLGGIQNLGRRHLMPRAEYNDSREEEGGPVRVPYLACYDEYVDSTPVCHRWDQGADAYEITMDYINSYREYFPLVNFQRDRVGFNPGAVGDRVFSRYFYPITNMYQHWLFDLIRGRTGDLRATYDQIGALRGFSLLWEVMATPRYGSYVQDGDAYRWFSYSKQDIASLYLQPGVGRREYSRYDVSGGYNVFQRILESGYFYEQMAALSALTSNDASIIGVAADVDADQLAYSIPYYLVFQEEIDHLLTSMVTRDAAAYAPRISGGQLIHKDLYLEAVGGIEEPEGYLEVSSSWSTRINTMVYAMALLQSNFDLSFLQKGQIALAGESETIEVGAGFEEVRLEDPVSGRIYVAYYDPAQSMDRFLGAKMLSQLQPLVERIGELEDPDSDEAISLRSTLSSRIGDVELLRSVYSFYQYVYY